MERRNVIRLAVMAVAAMAVASAGLILFAVGSGESGSGPAIDSIVTGKMRGVTREDTAVNEPAPDFELATLDGGWFRLSAHEGDVVVINFWATWCAPCRIEIPDLIEMQSDLEDEGVRFVGISLDFQGAEAVESFAEMVGFNYPIALDEGAVSEKFGGIYALPTTIVIDREGMIRQRIPGLVTRGFLMPILEDLAAGQSPSNDT